MINKMKLRKGGYSRGVSNSAKYLLKTNPQGDAIDCSIERLEGESDQAYANRIEKVFESARVPNQQNLYQFNSLSLHPSEGDKFTDAQMIEMAKEVYLRNGVKNGLTENRHTMFVVERNTKHHHVHAMIHLTDLETKKVNNKMIDYNPIIKKLELKYGLYNEHRKPKDEDEYKKTFKKELKTILENALTASEFLMLANGAGFDIHHSAKDAYSMTKDGQTFKASDLAVSYKTLKAALGDDPEFAATLASLHTDKPGNDDSGSITAPISKAPAPSQAPVNGSPTKAPAPDHGEEPEPQKSYSNYGSQASNERRKEMADFFKDLQRQKTLYVNYHHDDKGNYYFNRNDQKAFEFEASTGTVKYDRVTPSSAKAGLQKLMEDKNNRDIYVDGGEKFKREMWLQFHLMDMSGKGYTLKGFKPSKKDVEELARKLEDKTKYYNRSQESNVKSLPTEKPAQPLPIKSIEKPVAKFAAKAAETSPATDKPTLADTAGSVKDGGMKAASKVVAVAAGVLEGALQKVSDPTDALTGGSRSVMAEKLSEMRVLDAQIKNQNQSSENEHYENERRRLQQLRPT
ncbi:relaxase/mobilization nuclease domain-containing protein [Pseudomonas sp. O64]|uniref:relaxase/mobilization nuclease domain-containing protein n=1 Tax=unclassified Pseudomonas TaxID=196821 RepID=UPI00387AA77C